MRPSCFQVIPAFEIKYYVCGRRGVAVWTSAHAGGICGLDRGTQRCSVQCLLPCSPCYPCEIHRNIRQEILPAYAAFLFSGPAVEDRSGNPSPEPAVARLSPGKAAEIQTAP